jgi:hypothetical protein
VSLAAAWWLFIIVSVFVALAAALLVERVRHRRSLNRLRRYPKGVLPPPHPRALVDVWQGHRHEKTRRFDPVATVAPAEELR